MTGCEPLTPGEIYEVDVEIVSSCIVVSKGWRLALSVRGKDYEYDRRIVGVRQEVPLRHPRHRRHDP